MSSNEIKYFDMTLSDAIALSNSQNSQTIPADTNRPVAFPSQLQSWQPTDYNPYPMNFMQAPSYNHQRLVQFQGQPMLQGLSTVRGPFSFPVQTAYPNYSDYYSDYYDDYDQPENVVFVNGVPQGQGQVNSYSKPFWQEPATYPLGWSIPGPFQLNFMAPFMPR